MSYRTYIFFCVFFFCISSLSASVPPGENPEDCLFKHQCTPLFVLAQLIGTKKASALYADKKTIAMPESTYTFCKSLYETFPQEVCTLIASKIDFRTFPGLHKHYAQSFQKTELAANLHPRCPPRTCMLNNSTVATSGDFEPVQIWSVDTSSRTFQSTRISRQPICSFNSNLIVSASTLNHQLHMLRIQDKSFDDQTTLTLATPEKVEQLFTFSDHIIACTTEGSIEAYDIEKKATLFTLAQGHTGFIHSGMQYTDHNFVTGGTDSLICGWDVRTHEQSFATALYTDSVPYSIKRFDEYTLLVGCSRQPSLNGIDLRKPTDRYSIGCDAYPVYDIGILRDKTIVLCTQKVEFGYKKDTIFKNVHSIENTKTALSLSVSENDVIAVANYTGKVFFLKPSATPLCTWDSVPPSAALLGIALDDDAAIQ